MKPTVENNFIFLYHRVEYPFGAFPHNFLIQTCDYCLLTDFKVELLAVMGCNKKIQK